MHVVIVMADPLTSAFAFWATSAENCGESATTIVPQKIITTKNISAEKPKMNGEITQQNPEQARANVATLALPIFFENCPPTTQPKKPKPIMINDQKGIEKLFAFC